MIIGINEKQEVTFVAEGANEDVLDGEMSYKVDSVPSADLGKKLCFDPESETFYQKEYTEAEKASMSAARSMFLKKEKARQDKEKALAWLSENDWKINKHVLGEWIDTDERWLAYIKERAKVRAAIDEADLILNT